MSSPPAGAPSNLLEGLTNNSPPRSDASMKPGSGSVNDSPTRSGTPTVKAPGPRVA